MPSLKKDVEKKYVESGGQECPNCGSDSLTSESDFEINTELASTEVGCDDCGSLWVDVYKLSHVELKDDHGMSPYLVSSQKISGTVGNCTLTEAMNRISILSKEVYLRNNIAEIAVNGTSCIIVKDSTMGEMINQRHDGFSVLDYVCTINATKRIQMGDAVLSLDSYMCDETGLYKLKSGVDVEEMISLYKKAKEQNFSFTYRTHKI